MATLLQIDVSSRGEYSVSKKLSAAFAEQWKSKHLDGKVVVRDLTKTALPFVDLPWIAGAYSTPDQHTPEQKEALRISDELIAEIQGASEIVIGTPMYNFGVPAALKAWIDHVSRFGKTFNMGENGYEGLLGGRKATFLIASGGNYAPGSPAQRLNYESTYLEAIFGFLGITETKSIFSGDTTAVMQGKVSMEEYIGPHIQEVRAAVV